MKTAIVISSLGLVFDIIGFILISYTIFKQKVPKSDETTDFMDAFNQPLIRNVVNLNYLKGDKYAKCGFWLIISGFFLQLAGNIMNL